MNDSEVGFDGKALGQDLKTGRDLADLFTVHLDVDLLTDVER
jgi:hypothetical protein